MIKKIKNFILSGMLLLTVAAPAAVPSAVAFAASASGCAGTAGQAGGVPDQVANGATQAVGGGGAITCDTNSGTSGNVTSQVGTIAKEVVNVFTIIVGAASVFMIIYGGFRYITSGGSSDKVGNAKNTLIYAIVGLIIVGLAQIVVHFVLSQSASTGGTIAP